jgi:chromosome segregation ATPase
MEMEQRWNEAKAEVQSLSANLTTSQIEQQKLKESLQFANDHIHNLEEQLTKLQSRCSSHDAQYTKEQTKIFSVQKERDSMKSILEEERRTSEKLREDLADSVAREAVASEQIKTLLKEKTSLATQLNLASARNSFGNKTSPLLAKSINLPSYRNRPKPLDSSVKLTEKETPTEEPTVNPSTIPQVEKDEVKKPSSDEILLESGSLTLLDYIDQDDDDSLALL